MWTPNEEQFLRDNYNKMMFGELVAQLGKTRGQVSGKADRMGLMDKGKMSRPRSGRPRSSSGHVERRGGFMPRLPVKTFTRLERSGARHVQLATIHRTGRADVLRGADRAVAGAVRHLLRVPSRDVATATRGTAGEVQTGNLGKMTASLWITCPSCGWNYERHGDTHMSTRFNCARSRNTVADYPNDEPVAPWTGATIKLADAGDMLAEVRKIMAEQQLNYGPAVDEYIRRRQPDATFDLAARIAAGNV